MERGMVYPIAMIVAITLVVVVASCVGAWGSTAAAAWRIAYSAIGDGACRGMSAD